MTDVQTQPVSPITLGAILPQMHCTMSGCSDNNGKGFKGAFGLKVHTDAAHGNPQVIAERNARRNATRIANHGTGKSRKRRQRRTTAEVIAAGGTSRAFPTSSVSAAAAALEANNDAILVNRFVRIMFPTGMVSIDQVEQVMEIKAQVRKELSMILSR